MTIKHTTQRRIFWGVITFLCIAFVAIVVIPPMITLNAMRGRLESAIYENTGVATKINGNVNFSLVGGATVVAHDVQMPLGQIDSVMFSIPIWNIFNPTTAALHGDILIGGGRIKLTSLAAGQPLAGDVKIRDLTAEFLGKDYVITNATLRGGQLSGVVRTNDHKYNISYSADTFHITNPNNQLDITGQMYSDGSARGTISVITPDINRWFEFEYPKIDHPVEFSARFEWNGGYGVKFTDIRADKFSGDIILAADGARDIKLSGHGIEMDLSFISTNPNALRNAHMDIDLYGKIVFMGRILQRLSANINTTHDRADITRIIADDVSAIGGYIDNDGAHDISIRGPFQNKTATCLFSGTSTQWKCAEFTYDDMTGSLSVDNDGFNIVVQSNRPAPNYDTLTEILSPLGTRGHVVFQFADASGEFDIDTTPRTPTYTYARGRTLVDMGYDMAFLPAQMKNATGDFTRRGDTMEFIPYNTDWNISIDGNNFKIWGDNIKALAPQLDLRALHDMEYTATGVFRGGDVSNLVIKIMGHTFTGSIANGRITLHTDVFDIDTFTSQEFRDNYAEMEFITNSPLLIPFDVPVRVSLSAGRLVYNGNEFANFAYSLNGDTQTFSITDDARGAVAATIRRDGNTYDIDATLNKFITRGNLLRRDAGLNIRDTTITGTAKMRTWGNIAHDIEYNMTGDVDLTFDGGYIIGFGIDEFYGAADKIGTLNAELILSRALDGGESLIKTMHMIGHYSGGEFETTRPFTLSLRHADATGNLSITDAGVASDMQIKMRGAAPVPVVIDLEISSNGARQYSLSQIMTSFDPEYMREFIRTHNRF